MGDVSITIVYVDMDDVLCRYSDAHANALKSDPGIAFPQGIVGFFQSLDSVEGAVEAVDVLRDLYDVFILTAPSTRNPHAYSEKRLWVEEHFGYAFTKKLIISPDKGLLKGDYFDCLISIDLP